MTLLVFFAHHRCASSSTNDMLRYISACAGWRHRVLHDPHAQGLNLHEYCREEQPRILTLSNAKWAYAETLEDYVGAHIVRDPRDMLVSAYYSHRFSHPLDDWPELDAHRRRLNALGQEEGLLCELEFLRPRLEEMAGWRYGSGPVEEWRMEDFVLRPREHLSSLFSRWGRYDEAESARPRGLQRSWNRLALKLAVPYRYRWHSERVGSQCIEAAAQRYSFSRKSGGRKPGEGDAAHHYRLGTSGDWRGHFTPRVTEEFKARYGRLLCRLGYENDHDWNA